MAPMISRTRLGGRLCDSRSRGRRRPTGVGSMARMDSATGKVGKVSRVAEALPHSERWV
jgi:hypothetical protein